MSWCTDDGHMTSHDLPLQEVFEAVNKAYEFLCSKSAKRTEGPDPHRIVLLLQTQSILFKRYADGQPSFTAKSIKLDQFLPLTENWGQDVTLPYTLPPISGSGKN